MALKNVSLWIGFGAIVLAVAIFVSYHLWAEGLWCHNQLGPCI